MGLSVGVLVPVRAPAPWLGASLEAILAQEPAAVVVVDDGSEEPIALSEAHAQRCRRMRREVPGGPGAARNTGLAALDTEWVAFCDADDIWRRGKLTVQLAAIAAHPEAAVCVGAAEIVDAGGRATGERWPELPEGAYAGPELAPRLYEENPILLSSCVVRAESLRAAGGFDESLVQGEDWDLWLRLASRGAVFVSAPGARVAYRRHRHGLTADVAALARSQLELHRRHAGLVEPEVVRRARRRDLLALADGCIAQRSWAEARQAFAEAAQLGPLPARSRARAALTHVRGVRAVLGRRSPYAPRPG